MSSQFLTDKSLALEAAFYGFALDTAPAFAEPGISPNYAPDRPFHLASIDLHLTIDPLAGTLIGEAVLDIQPQPFGLGDVVLDLDDMDVDSVELIDGTELDYSEDDGKLHIHGVPSKGSKVRISWHGNPTRGLYFTGPTPADASRKHTAWSQCQDEDAHFFFPCIDHPSVKCSWTMRFTVPDGYQAIGNGRFDGREGNTWKWVQAEPMPTYLFTVCVGKFAIYEDEGASVPVRYLAPEGVDDATFKRIFGKTPAMINFFEKRYGHPYAWARYDQVVVHDFIFGGMENVASTTLTDLVLTDERAALDWNAESLIAHELAHQWFGDLVTCQDWSQGYLNEAWATYSEILWKVEDLGQEEADYHLYDDLKNYLSECASRYKRPIVSYQFREPIDMFDRHLYEKGALVVHTLRTILGEEAFWPAVTRYLKDNAHTTVHTRDFQVAMEQTSGRNLDGFFQDWILSPGHPALTIKTAWTQGLLKVTVTQRQKGDEVPEAYQFPLSLLIVTNGGEQTVTLPVAERSRTWAIPLEKEPTRVEIDSGFKILANLTVQGSRKLLTASLKDDTSIVGRIRAAKALAKDGSPKAVSALADALKNESFWGVRTEIAAMLGKIGTDTTRVALLSCVNDEHPKARNAIVTALGHLPVHPDLIEVLTGIVKNGDPSIHVEGGAIRSLGRLRAPGTIELALEVIERPSWGSLLSCRALEALALTRDEAAMPHLLRWTEDDKNERARCTAAAGLGRLAVSLHTVRKESVERLIELVRTGGFRLKLTAVSTLGSIQDPGGIPVLRDIHEGQSDGRVRRAAYEAIQRISKGNRSGASITQLRRDLDQVRDQNKKLRGRVDLLERTQTDK
jgi:aminopeptidase N